MPNIVYILGAGFSQPLGLPLMSNFIDLARDLYSTDKQKYIHFSNVFTLIHDKLAWIKTIFDTDLNNIEEVLSILEMRYYVEKGNEQELLEYKQFLADVINYYTPKFQINSNLIATAKGMYGLPSNLIENAKNADNLNKVPFMQTLFPDYLSRSYISFVLALFNKRFEFSFPGGNLWKVDCASILNPYAEYSIITLNYDLVLEMTASFLSSVLIDPPLKFTRPKDSKENLSFPTLVKLHGSIDEQNIVPPTWNKTLRANVEEEWQTAYRLLGAANHIRIIGYSLPLTDSYVRYLLKASIIKNDNLKSIAVYNLDLGNNIKNRYDEFIKLPPDKYRYFNQDAGELLRNISERFLMHDELMDNPPKVYF